MTQRLIVTGRDSDRCLYLARDGSVYGMLVVIILLGTEPLTSGFVLWREGGLWECWEKCRLWGKLGAL